MASRSADLVASRLRRRHALPASLEVPTTLLGLLFLLLVAGVLGAVARALGGGTCGGCFVSIAVGFAGALVGVVLARWTGPGDLFVISAGSTRFPVARSIVGGGPFVGPLDLPRRAGTQPAGPGDRARRLRALLGFERDRGIEPAWDAQWRGRSIRVPPCGAERGSRGSSHLHGDPGGDGRRQPDLAAFRGGPRHSRSARAAGLPALGARGVPPEQARRRAAPAAVTAGMALLRKIRVCSRDRTESMCPWARDTLATR